MDIYMVKWRVCEVVENSAFFYLSQDFIPKNILNTDIAPITSASYNVINVISWNKS